MSPAIDLPTTQSKDTINFSIFASFICLICLAVMRRPASTITLPSGKVILVKATSPLNLSGFKSKIN